jgi:hypothetical protein
MDSRGVRAMLLRGPGGVYGCPNAFRNSWSGRTGRNRWRGSRPHGNAVAVNVRPVFQPDEKGN